MRAHNYIPRVRVAVHPAPVKYLRAEEVDHCLHHPLRTPTQRREAVGGERVGAGGGGAVVAHEARDAALVAEPDAINPLGGHDLLGGELGEDARDVNVVYEAGFGGDECGGGASVFSLEPKIKFASKVIRDEICTVSAHEQ